MKTLQLSEHKEQELFFKWLNLAYPFESNFCYHIPNGRKDAIEGAKYKRLGAKAGVPDVHIAYPIYPYHGLYIEFKRGNKLGFVSKSQREWINRLNSVGYKVEVCHGFEEAKKVVEIYFM